MFRPGPPRDLRALPDRFRFGDVEVDVPAVRVTRAASPVALEPKSFDVLLLLAANRGRVVEKDEIVERVWRDVGVTDNALTRVIAHLRRDLGDEAAEARYIETARTRGYRFLPDLEPVGEPLRAVEAPSTALMPRRWWLFAACGAAAVVVAGLVAVGLHARRTARPTPPVTLEAPLTPVQLTLSPGYNGDPSFSPDGQSVAYTSERDGKMDIFIRRLDDGSELQVTHGGGHVEPAFSPDGGWIAFHSRSRGGLWLVSSLGGEPRQLTVAGSQPAWSPDGRQIAFRTQPTLALGERDQPGQPGTVVAVVDVKSGQVRRLTTSAHPPAGHGAPAWMPDGRAVVFAAGNMRQQGIYLVGAEGGNVETLVETVTQPGARRVSWWWDPAPLPDGSAVLAIRSAESDSIQRLPLPPGSAKPVALVPLAPLGTNHLAVSPDGERLAFAVGSRESQIETVPVDAQGRRTGAPRVIAHDSALRFAAVSFSPDGRWLSYYRAHPGTESDVLVVETATGNARFVGARGAEPSWGRWWASASEIVLRGLRVDLVTGRRLQLGALPGWARLVDRHRYRLGLQGPDFLSPDGSREVFSAAVGTASEIFVWRVGAEDAVQVTRFGRIAIFPTWSSDGARILVEVMDPGATTNELWLMRPDGTDPRRLLTATGPSWVLTTFSTGSLVHYAALRGAQWDLAVAGPDVPERLLGLRVSEAGYVRAPTWSPQQHLIAYESSIARSNIWTMRLTAKR